MNEDDVECDDGDSARIKSSKMNALMPPKRFSEAVDMLLVEAVTSKGYVRMLSWLCPLLKDSKRLHDYGQERATQEAVTTLEKVEDKEEEAVMDNDRVKEEEEEKEDPSYEEEEEDDEEEEDVELEEEEDEGEAEEEEEEEEYDDDYIELLEGKRRGKRRRGASSPRTPLASVRRR